MSVKLKHLREWINTLPHDFDDHLVVVRETGVLGEPDDNWFAKDTPINTLGVDEENKEICFLNEND